MTSANFGYMNEPVVGDLKIESGRILCFDGTDWIVCERIENACPSMRRYLLGLAH